MARWIIDPDGEGDFTSVEEAYRDPRVKAGHLLVDKPMRARVVLLATGEEVEIPGARWHWNGELWELYGGGVCFTKDIEKIRGGFPTYRILAPSPLEDGTSVEGENQVPERAGHECETLTITAEPWSRWKGPGPKDGV